MDISLLVSARDVSPVDESFDDFEVLEPAEVLESPTTKDIPPFPIDAEFDEETDPNVVYENPILVMTKTTRQIWSKEERELLNRLRAEGKKWKEVALSFPGRTAASCRSQWHYQNQTNKDKEKEQAEKERNNSEAVQKEIAGVPENGWDTHEWSEELKDELAKTYNKFKAQLWSTIAVEIGEPWKAVESWHWVMGPIEIASRAAAVVKEEKASSHRDSSPDLPRSPRFMCSPSEQDSSKEAKLQDPKSYEESPSFRS